MIVFEDPGSALEEAEILSLDCKKDFVIASDEKLPNRESLVATKKEKNFFETRVTDYQVGSLKFDDDEEDIWEMK